MICLVLCRFIIICLFILLFVWVFIPLGIIWLSWICGLVSVIILEISFPLWLQTLLCPVFSFWISKNTYVSLILLYISWILSNVFPCVLKIFICLFVFSHAGSSLLPVSFLSLWSESLSLGHAGSVVSAWELQSTGSWLSCLAAVRSSWTVDQTYVPCIARQIPNPWGELHIFFLNSLSIIFVFWFRSFLLAFFEFIDSFIDCVSLMSLLKTFSVSLVGFPLFAFEYLF